MPVHDSPPLPPVAVTAATPSAAAPTGPGRRPRLYVLDGLRLLAALYVVAYHYTAFAEHDPHPWGRPVHEVFPVFNRFSSYGFLGVQLFFLISGFVICMTAWGRTPKDFLISRVTRLFPAYWFAIAATTVFVLLAGGHWLRYGRGIDQFLTNLTMLQDPLKVSDVDGVYWTLWCELVFYLLFLVVVRAGLSYQRVVSFCGIWLVAGVISTGSGDSIVRTLTMPGQAPYFAGGVAIYLMHRYGPDLLLAGLTGLCWLLSLHQLATQLPEVSGHVGHHLQFGYAAAFVTACYAVLIAAALGRLDWIRWRGLTTLGALTYPLYLLHEDIGWGVILHLHDTVPAWALVGGVTAFFLYAAWLVHRYVERPLARYLKRGLSKPRPAR
ncbi:MULTISPECIES: acyltransferase family protein [Streptomycetaceae]|nr:MULTISPECIES: acyltransferase [Streptomycetaceae]